MQNQQVLIAGAGIGGLSAALALQRAGHRVRLYEQSGELTEVGAGLSLSPNASLGLHALGLARELANIGHTPKSFGVKHGLHNTLLLDNTREMTKDNAAGAPYYMVHRADLQRILAEAVLANDPDCLRLDCSLKTFTQKHDCVVADFSDGSSVKGDLLVGCDGIRSAVRATLFGAESPRFTGYIAWRGLVPADRLAGPLSPESGICIGPGKTVTRYLLAQRQVVNYVAVARRSGWEVESWAVHSEVAELLGEFADFHPEIKQLLAATPPENCYKWALFDREPLTQWSVGRVTLAGDAAHPMLPFMGQGAVMAIEDAVVFARCLDASATIGEALERYETARRDRCTFVMLESRANIRRLQTADPDHYGMQSHRNEQRLGLFDYDPLTVSI